MEREVVVDCGHGISFREFLFPPPRFPGLFSGRQAQDKVRGERKKKGDF